LPWLLGPIACGVAISVAGVSAAPPLVLTDGARAVFGFAIGAAFTPDVIDALPSYAAAVGLLPIYLLVTIGLGYPLFRRYARFDRPTAFFASSPGGFQDMVTFAESAGANLRAVALVHATRLLVIVYALPFWIEWGMGVPIGDRAPSAVAAADVTLLDAAAIVVCCGLGYIGARALRLAGAAVVGPLFVSAAAPRLGWVGAPAPAPVPVGSPTVIGRRTDRVSPASL